ncbi:hypothetical protein [Ulvibacter litoralis]|nr:hypothetical protein [Ulvibacter litoralis]
MLFFATALLLFISCDTKDDESTTANFSSENSERAVQVDGIAEGSYAILERGYVENEQGPTPKTMSSLFPDCTTVEIVLTGDGGTIVIDFGDECELNNGAVVSGKISMIFGAFVNGTRTISYTFDNYTYNGNGVEGGGEILREIANQNGNPQSTVNESIVVSFPSVNITASRTGMRVVEWTEGFFNGNWFDNVFEITGNWQTTFSNGFSRSGEVTQALIRELSCQYIVSGRLVVTQNNESGEFDWGDGTCDNQATFTYNGEVYPITL